MDPHTTSAWRKVSETGKAVSSRIVSARMEIAGQGDFRSSRRSSSSPSFMTVISVYAPTHRATQEKDEFNADLQEAIDRVHADDVFLLVGDFNARMGCSERRDDGSMWNGVRGYHGTGKMNENGEALLTFCVLNDLNYHY